MATILQSMDEEEEKHQIEKLKDIFTFAIRSRDVHF
jgi:hypothetical protein